MRIDPTTAPGAGPMMDDVENSDEWFDLEDVHYMDAYSNRTLHWRRSATHPRTVELRVLEGDVWSPLDGLEVR
jgi:hypothetical protein